MCAQKCFSVWSNTPWISPVLSAWRPTVPQRWLGRRRAPLRCWCATVRLPDTPSPYTCKMNCIIHQEALCAKSANLVDVMGVVVKVVNSILSRSLHHRQFQALVDEVNVQYGDLLYFCEVRWLSRGAMLSHVCGLQKEIATFCRQKNLSHADQLFDPRWLARLALLTDITTHLNAINVKLRGKDITSNKHARTLSPPSR